MRKLLLTVLALVMLSSSCLAANWEWINSDANLGAFYDTDSIRFDMSQKQKIINRDKFVVWVKFVYDESYARKRGLPKGTKYSISKIWFDVTQNRFCEEQLLFYDADNINIATDKGTWDNIVPGTAGEGILKRVHKYVRAHTEEIEQRTRGAH
jgi:hypothetical protein